MGKGGRKIERRIGKKEREIEGKKVTSRYRDMLWLEKKPPLTVNTEINK